MGKRASAYLAGFARFIIARDEHSYLNNLLLTGFRQYFTHYILPLTGNGVNGPVALTGSIAHHYPKLLAQVAHEYQLQVANTAANPVNGLVQYHSLGNSLRP